MASPWKTAETGTIVTTTPTVEGRPVQDYLGIVTGEAIIGAIYLDAGLSTARKFIEKGWAPQFQAPLAEAKDPKTLLQEWAHLVCLPTATLLAECLQTVSLQQKRKQDRQAQQMVIPPQQRLQPPS